MERGDYNFCALIDDVLNNAEHTLREIVAEECPHIPVAGTVPEDTTLPMIWYALLNGDTERLDKLCGEFANSRHIAFEAMSVQSGLPPEFFDKLHHNEVDAAFDVLKEDFLKGGERL